jgi:hypothetical protein
MGGKKNKRKAVENGIDKFQGSYLDFFVLRKRTNLVTAVENMVCNFNL